jgi:hypothetical protein
MECVFKKMTVVEWSEVLDLPMSKGPQSDTCIRYKWRICGFDKNDLQVPEK